MGPCRRYYYRVIVVIRRGGKKSLTDGRRNRVYAPFSSQHYRRHDDFEDMPLRGGGSILTEKKFGCQFVQFFN